MSQESVRGDVGKIVLPHIAEAKPEELKQGTERARKM